MTTKRKLAFQIERLLSAGPKTRDSKIDRRYLMEQIVQVANQLIRREYFNKMNAGDRDVDAVCIATYADIPVLNDETRGRNYCELPVIPEPLPGGYGVQQVKPQSDNPAIAVAMIPIMPMEMELLGGGLAGAEIMKDQFCWELDRVRIYFTEKNDQTLLDSDIDTVELKLVVVDPSTIGEDDVFPVAPSQEIEIIMAVCQQYGYTTKEVTDLTNNGSNIK